MPISGLFVGYLLDEASEELVLALALLPQDEDVSVSEGDLFGDVGVLVVKVLEKGEQNRAPFLQVTIHYYLYMPSQQSNKSK